MRRLLSSRWGRLALLGLTTQAILASPAASIAVAAGHSGAVDWSQSRFDPAHTGLNPLESTLGPGNVGQLQLKWQVDLRQPIVQSSPAVVQGTLYVGGDDDALHAIDATSGTLLWTYQTGGDIFSAPAVVDGLVYFGSGDGTFNAVDAGSGSLTWSYDLAGTPMLGTPTVADGVVYAMADDETLRAWDATTGVLRWAHSFGSVGCSSVTWAPSVADGLVFMASGCTEDFAALDATTGSIVWVAPHVVCCATAAVAEGKVFLVRYGRDGELRALDESTGRPLWVGRLGNIPYSSPAVANGRVYVGSQNGQLRAFDESTGAFLWAAATKPIGRSGAVVANGLVYVGSFSGNGANVYAMDAATGAVLWQGHVPGGALADLTVVNGTVYVASFTGSVLAFGLP